MPKIKGRISFFVFIIISIFAFCLCACSNSEHSHTYGEWEETIPATCTKNGLKTRYCTGCPDKQEEIILGRGHKFVNGICSVCNAAENPNQGGDQHTHIYGEWIAEVAAKCEEAGVKGHYECKECHKYFDANKQEIKDLTITKLEHKYVDGVCSECGTEDPDYVEHPTKNFVFQANGNGYAIVGYTGKAKEVTVPSTYEEKPVTIIGEKAFYNCSSIEKINLPDSIIEISEYAFGYCSALTEITIPNCTRVRDNAFMGCGSLIELAIPSDCVELGKGAFIGCSKLKKLTLNGDTITSDTLQGCDKVTELTIGSSIQAIEAGSLALLTSLETLYIPYIPTTVKDLFENASSSQKTFNGTIYVTEERLSTNSAKIQGYNVIILNKYPVAKIESPDTEFYPDTLYNDIRLTVTREDNVPEDLELRQEYLSASDRNKLLTEGSHNVNVTIEGFTAMVTVKIKFYTFEGVKLDSKELIYDGTAKSLEVTGAPEGTKITYENNNKIAIGEYTVNATLTKQYYQTKTLSATLTILKNSYSVYYELGLENVTNNNPSTFIADGADITLVAPVRPGYEFLGWYSDSEYKTKITKIAGNTHQDVTVYAKWQTVFTLSGGTITGLTDYGKEQFVLIIDSVINGVKITSIGSSAFYDCSSLESITIPSGVTSIGEQAFYKCNSLTKVYISDIAAWCKISFGSSSSNPLYYAHNLYLDGELVTKLTIPSEITEINSYAFCACSSLTSVTISDSVTSIGDMAFYGCSSLEEITIPSEVTSIGSSAFYGCSSLEEITIPSGVTSIGTVAFAACSSLTSITIPSGVTTIGDGAFRNCTSLSMVYWNATNCIRAGTYVSYYDYTIFSGCTKLTTVVIGDNVEIIPSYAFAACSRLTSVTVGNSITSIGDLAFYGCSSLAKVYIRDIAAWCKISFGDSSANPLNYGAKLYLDGGLVTELTIPSEITEINNYAFYGCSSLINVTIDNSVTSIGDSAFHICSWLRGVYISDIAAWCKISFGNGFANPLNYGAKLYLDGELVTDLAIPSGVTEINNYAFYGCSSLISVTIGNSVMSIGNYAFRDCSSLSEITIGNRVTSIGDLAFRNCTSLSMVYWNATNCMRAGSYNIYNDYTIFSGCTKLTTVAIGDNVEIIPNSAFCDCSSLSEITIPNSVTSIGDYAFRNCSSLSEITIGNRVTSIGDLAFATCSSLTSVTIPDRVTSIGDLAFAACSSLTSVTIPDRVTSIGDYAFAYCSSLSEITIPSGVTSIGDSVFRNCSSLTSVTIPDRVTSIGGFAFAYCSSLSEITIPDSVTSIGDYAFAYCDGLTSVTIGNSVTSIGDWAFAYCDGLTSVTFKNTDGWWCSSSSSETSGTAITGLEDPEIAAKYLTSTYYEYYWKRS